MTVFYVAAGGALGASLRYGVGVLTKQWMPHFPLGTVLVNLVGCLLMGILAGAWGQESAVPKALQAGVLVGFLGGLTTFSSFGLDTVTLARGDQWAPAVFNVVLQTVLGIAFVVGGLRMGLALQDR